MALANPAGLALLALAIPILLLHVLRPRRQAVEVSSTFLWRDLAQPVSAASPWQRLRPSVLLFLQLLAVLLLAVAVAQPVKVADSGLYDHTVFIVDASGSMLATDGDPDRLTDAVDRARELRDDLPSGGKASIVVAATAPQVLLNASPDPDQFEEALRGIEATAGHADFGGAFALAASLETADTPTGFVLVSDGGLTDIEKEQLLADTTYEQVGERATNRAISRLTVENRGSGLHVLVTVRNTGGEAVTQTLRVDVDEQTVAEEEVRLARDASTDIAFDVSAGDRVEAFLEGEDLLDADDHAFAVAARRRALDVLVVVPVGDPADEGEGDDAAGDEAEGEADEAPAADPFLTDLLGAMDGVEVEVRETTTAGVVADGQDLVIYDRVDVPADPGAPFLAIAPPGGVPGTVEVSGSVELPAIALVRGDDPLLEGVDLTDVAIGLAQQIDAPAGQVLVAGEAAPLLVRGMHAQRPYAYLSFGLADSTLPLTVAYPVLFDRLVNELAGAALPPSGVVVGDVLPVDRAVETKISRPAGTALTLAPGSAAPVADRPGFWVIESEGRPARTVAVNADPSESALSPAPSLPTEVRIDTAAREPARVEDLWLWPVIGLLLLVLIAEWLVARRSVGVSRRQWRVATALRVGVAACLVLALLGVTIDREAKGVATVFLVDGSDSLGAAGRAEAVSFVRDALDEQPESARSAVAIFGGDARLELTLGQHDQLDEPSVSIDATHTDLATALRLGGAVLPEDARRRIVIVSDGRATRGDATLEAERLRDRGIEVDVVVLEREGGPDLAVTAVDVPGRVAEGERIEVTATVESTDGGPSTITLLQGGDVVEEREVDLDPGTNEVAFEVEAAEVGLERFQVRVEGSENSVVENDVGYAAVEVAGPERILVVEGTDDAADDLTDAFEEGGLDAEVVEPEDIPALDELSVYSAIVLVDVDERSLSSAQITALSGAVRDLGRGLVTIGGDQSYALGGYYESELEELLPVISEVQDPERRRTIAQVMAIDTSGSMGACHCDEGANGPVGGNRGPEGGVNKTDIARSAAARAIEALSENDEVGVLAFNVGEKWVVPLQQLPAEEVILDGLRSLQPSGGTDMSESLSTAAEALRSSKASLRHIVLFSDGFTEQSDLSDLADQAEELRDEGITVSVIATGEGAAEELEPIAERGGGRFYPGRDLQEIPQIMLEETFIASRNFVNEGEFLPTITSSADVVDGLTEAPPLLGYLATTAKPSATTHLRVGEYDDPLLATWQIGLGRSTAWTSDASQRWSAPWAGWDGYVDFWSRVVKDVLPPQSDAGSVRASVVDGMLQVRTESTEAWPDDAKAQARVAMPDGSSVEVPLERLDSTTFAGEVAADIAGTYAVGAEVTGASGSLLAGRSLATLSYSSEYEPGPADEAALVRVSEQSGGRGVIEAAQAFDAEGLEPGRSQVELAGWLLLLAALLWPIGVAVSRLSLRGSAVSSVRTATVSLRSRVRGFVPATPSRAERATTGDGRAAPTGPDAGGTAGQAAEPSYRKIDEPKPAPTPDAPPATVGRLLERKRQHREGS